MRRNEWRARADCIGDAIDVALWWRTSKSSDPRTPRGIGHPRIQTQRLRHPPAFLVSRDKDVKAIQELLRQAKSSTTLDLYAQRRRQA